ncbi:MAG: BatA domain-containing protein [Bacteroidia bacterium]|nr:BatA domain-containing protein [Bacteroidia bacterium]
MQFKHPEILFALLLLLIPIIVHLFQLRRFKKVEFTNVEFLKKVNIQTRKSQRLKKWLTLISRLLLLACIIFAFAQPFTSENIGTNTKSETVIYLDNTFSMQAKGEKGELLKRAIQDLLNSVDDKEEVRIFTNDLTFRNVPLKSIRNELLQIQYTNTQLDYDAAFLKGSKLFSKGNDVLRNFVLLSDFQQNRKLPTVINDSLIKSYWVQLEPVGRSNISIDSVYMVKSNSSTIELNVVVNQQNTQVENMPVSLYNGDDLIAKTAVANGSSSIATFTIANNAKINGKITVDDAMLQFDNSLYFNINEKDKIKVLSINSADDNYLSSIFTEDEFVYQSVGLSDLNYNDINSQNLIVLNEITNLPTALINALNSYASNNGFIIIIPSIDPNISSYNQILGQLTNIIYNRTNPQERRITGINFSHPLYSEVFDKEVTNFQYPKVNSYLTINSSNSPILELEDGSPFLLQSNNTYVFTAALNTENSNVINSPLIVPTLYNIGRQSFKLPKLYFTIGNDNSFEINTSIQQDDIIKLRSSDIEIIPQQRALTDKVMVSTSEAPAIAGIYDVISDNEVIENVSFNYNRSESDLNYHNLDNLSNASLSDSIPEVVNSIKSASNINALWKWFAIFALIFLIFEMLILKFIR